MGRIDRSNGQDATMERRHIGLGLKIDDKIIVWTKVPSIK